MELEELKKLWTLFLVDNYLIVKLLQIILCFYHDAFLGYVVPTSERKHVVECK